jgi:hypothetical protein
MSQKKDQLGKNGFILISKIGKATTNMHRVFHTRKQFELKEEIQFS